MHSLSSEESTRYHRQIIIPEIGQQGQIKLKNASVFLSGLGGLGSVSAYYLVAAGIGHLRLVDRDRVELGNLNRQILHWTDDINRPKTDSAIEKLCRLNPECRIEAFHEEIREDNVLDLIGDCSLIVDGTDNVRTRKVLNRASLQKGIPFIVGGVEGLSGMATTLIPDQTPCFECIFPLTASQQRVPGVLGPLPGLVASIQVLEAVKLILGISGILKCRLLLIQGAEMHFKTINVERNPDCDVCNPKRGYASDE